MFIDTIEDEEYKEFGEKTIQYGISGPDKYRCVDD